MSETRYHRILLKLSGEALAGPEKKGIHNPTLTAIAENIKKLSEMGVQVGVVVGGGNFWRGRSSEHMDRVTADHMGMLATCMNALALSDALRQANCETRVLSAIEMRQIAETHIRLRALRHLEKGRIVIFACGTGNPYFSTDTTAALRAAEISAEAIFKASNVDGVYDKDPNIYPDSKRYETLTHDEVLQNKLGVMDATAAALCRENKMDIYVFDVTDPENIVRIIRGEHLGTLVH
ncbi:MAG: UMP kinase [Eubacteriales bacterium]|nr:UMP kinase [Eubacteriales bacterium]